ncbi:MAG: polysaccharide deacetylase family protein [Gemmatimonadetes bacterium]|nr:polysaccharide deacetylase family protein [Gemmatimonadota bacterium]
MRPKPDPVTRTRSAKHRLGRIILLGILGVGVVAAAALVWGSLDGRQPATSSGLLPAPAPPARAAFPGRSFPVVLFNSPRNRSFFPDSTFYPTALAQWAGLVQALGGEVREVGSVAELLALEPRELLLLPEAPCLSEAEVAAIRAHLAAEGSLVSNWAVGARDEKGAWRGWQTVAQLAGAGGVQELGTGRELYLTVPAETPLSAGLDAGTRIELRPAPSPALTLPGPRVYWSDWALDPAPDESGGGADVAALTTVTEAGGRAAWFGFRLSQGATPRDSVLLQRMVQNGVLWAAGIPTASPSAWPGGERAAMVLDEDVESDYKSSLAMAQLLEEVDLPGSFYVVSGLVQDDREVVEALAAAGEVGSHTTDHKPLGGLPFREQLRRLRQSQSDLEEWTGEDVDGLRPPEESFDSGTLRAWEELGGHYISASNQDRSASPEIHRTGGGTMVLLPRLMPDDYNVFAQEGGIDSDRISDAFVEGARKLRTIGGLAVVGTHTQIVGAGGRLDAVRTLADTVRAQGDWWVATGRDVAQWWKKRAQVRVTFLQPGSHSPGLRGDSTPDSLAAHRPEFRILVEAPESESIEGLWIYVVLPEGPDRLVPLVEGSPAPFVAAEGGVRVSVGDLAGGASRIIAFADLEGEPGQPAS